MKNFFSRYKKLHIWLLILLFLLALFLIFRTDRDLMNWLATEVTQPMKDAVASVCYLVSFPVIEILYILAGAWVVLHIVVSAVKIHRSKGHRRSAAYRGFLILLCVVLTVADWFCLVWGINYYADGFQEKSGLYAQEVELSELYRVAAYFTEALNTAIRGTLCEGDEVICSHAEHNAVMRVLKGLEEQGAIRVRMLAPNSLGLIAPEALTAAITPRTALCVICHASNVTGVVQPVQQLSRALKPYGVPLLVDAAQTAGILDVSLSSLGADMIAIPGHKGLLGPHGTGVLVLGRGMLPRPLVVGGTGSQSESMIQPE